MTGLNRDPDCLPNGLQPEQLAESCARLFGSVVAGVRRIEYRGRIGGGGWGEVGRRAIALYLADTCQVVTVEALAAMLRKAYARGEGRIGSELPWEQLPPLFRVAWEAVARHIAWAVGDWQAGDRLRDGEYHRARVAETEVQQRGIIRARQR